LAEQKTAVAVYLDTMARGSVDQQLRRPDRARAKLIMEWFSTFATAEELRILGPAAAGSTVDDGARRVLAAKLHDLVVARLAHAFAEEGKTPVGLKGPVTLRPSSIEERLKKVTVAVDRDKFAAFRAERESSAKTGGGSSAAGAKRQRTAGEAGAGSGSGSRAWSFARQQPGAGDVAVACTQSPLHGGDGAPRGGAEDPGE